ncbi:MAG: EamA family transporter, partial [Sphaerochaetaceae bacterium]
IKDGKIKIPTKSELFNALIMGFFLFVSGVGLVTFGQQFTFSYITSLIVASVPLLVAFFDYILYKKRITKTSLIGIFLGLVGIAVLFYDGSTTKFEISVGLILIFVGIVSWSFATSISYKLRTHENTLVNSGIQMIFAGSVCSVIMLFSNYSWQPLLVNITPMSIWSILYLTMVGSFTFNSYIYLIKNYSPQKVSSYAFVNPLVGILFGILFGGEDIVPNLFIGLTLILTGLLFHFYGRSLFVKVLKYLKKPNN